MALKYVFDKKDLKKDIYLKRGWWALTQQHPNPNQASFLFFLPGSYIYKYNEEMGIAASNDKSPREYCFIKSDILHFKDYSDGCFIDIRENQWA